MRHILGFCSFEIRKLWGSTIGIKPWIDWTFLISKGDFKKVLTEQPLEDVHLEKVILVNVRECVQVGSLFIRSRWLEQKQIWSQSWVLKKYFNLTPLTSRGRDCIAFQDSNAWIWYILYTILCVYVSDLIHRAQHVMLYGAVLLFDRNA